MIREFKGKSVIGLPDSFTIIDTETTGLDYEYCDLIEIAAIRVRNGIAVERFSSLVQPPLEEYWDDGSDDPKYEYVGSYITELTGITNDMLADAPRPEDVIPQFISFISDDLLIGHNVNFDINFLYDASQKLNIKLSNDFIDTMRIARKLLPDLKYHRLKDLVAHFKIKHDNAHRSLSDCEATLRCYVELKNMALSQCSEEEFRKLFSRSHSSLDARTITAETADFDETHPLYGKVVVFTGALSCMQRKDAMQLVANLGGYNGNGVTKKTNFLVVGSEEFVSSVKNGKTNKMKKAEDLQRNGADIVVISESTFFDMVGYLN